MAKHLTSRLLTAALALPPDQRVRLAGELLATVDGKTITKQDWTAHWSHQSSRRQDEVHKGKVTVEDPLRVLEAVRRRLAKMTGSPSQAPAAHPARRAPGPGMAGLSLHPAVALEIADAARWYETRRPGTGPKLIADVERTLLTVRRQPADPPPAFVAALNLGPIIRHRRLRQFPLALHHLGHCVLALAFLRPDRK